MAAQQRASVTSAAAGSWLGLRLQLMAAALAAAVAVAAVAEHAGALPWGLASGPGAAEAAGTVGSAAAAEGAAVGGRPSSGHSMAAGLVGLSLSYVLPITGLLSGLLSASAETGGKPMGWRYTGGWHLSPLSVQSHALKDPGAVLERAALPF